MRPLALLLIAALLPLSVHAAGKLYKWTDENGVTHYSDEPPAGRDFESRVVKGVPGGDLAADEAEPEDGAEGEAAAPPAESENCRILRRNVAALQIPGPVRMDLDGDGEAEPLNEEQKQGQLDITRRQLAVYCGEPAGEDEADEQDWDSYDSRY